jgi:hypothetical protein
VDWRGKVVGWWEVHSCTVEGHKKRTKTRRLWNTGIEEQCWSRKMQENNWPVEHDFPASPCQRCELGDLGRRTSCSELCADDRYIVYESAESCWLYCGDDRRRAG